MPHCIEPPAHLAGKVRDILSAYVRLTVSERKKWFFMGSVFTISGPQADMKRASQEVEAAMVEDWHDRAW